MPACVAICHIVPGCANNADRGRPDNSMTKADPPGNARGRQPWDRPYGQSVDLIFQPVGAHRPRQVGGQHETEPHDNSLGMLHCWKLTLPLSTLGCIDEPTRSVNQWPPIRHGA